MFKFSVEFRSGLFTGRVIDFIYLCWRKTLIPFALWQDTLLFWKMSSSSPNQFSMDGMRRLSRILICTCALIVECCLVPLSFKWHATPYQWLPKFTRFLYICLFFFSFSYLFFHTVTLMCFIWTVSDKIPASLLWPMQILSSSLRITFIQFSTCHVSFSLISFSSVYV